MKFIIIAVHVSVCIALIMIVLLQRGKGADMGAAFGGSSQTLFGSPGAAGFLTKITTMAAIVFMVTSLVLAFWSTPQKASLLPDQPVSEETVPAEREGLPPLGTE